MRVVKSRTGKKITLLNLAEKGRKYSAELKAGIRATNNHEVKRDKNGKKNYFNKKSKGLAFWLFNCS